MVPSALLVGSTAGVFLMAFGIGEEEEAEARIGGEAGLLRLEESSRKGDACPLGLLMEVRGRLASEQAVNRRMCPVQGAVRIQ
mmetsp:Transcript_34152/g.80085  ORF Transcript_34152/g.80085 Transcript_34152/m.80085 type:complete len:83 (+) Transcript_34152:648-896(+)